MRPALFIFSLPCKTHSQGQVAQCGCVIGPKSLHILEFCIHVGITDGQNDPRFGGKGELPVVAFKGKGADLPGNPNTVRMSSILGNLGRFIIR
jgi:hypothetical protein